MKVAPTTGKKPVPPEPGLYEVLHPTVMYDLTRMELRDRTGWDCRLPKGEIVFLVDARETDTTLFQTTENYRLHYKVLFGEKVLEAYWSFLAFTTTFRKV